MVVDLQCYEGRNLDTVTQAETLAPYGEQIAGTTAPTRRQRPSSRPPTG
jgi:hypothetical protein